MTATPSPWPSGHPLGAGLSSEPLAYIAEELAQGEMTFDEILALLTELVERVTQ